MTREELKAHCIKQVEQCEMWAKHWGEEPHGKVYEEHKLVLELLEQESVLDKIKIEIADIYCGQYCEDPITPYAVREAALEIIDKYRQQSEE